MSTPAAEQAADGLRHRREIGPSVRYLGRSADVVDCDNCGRREIERGTVALATLDDEGNWDGVTYYGSDCAAKALARSTGRRVSAAKVLEEARQADRETRRKGELAERALTRLGADEDGGGLTQMRDRTRAIIEMRGMGEDRLNRDRAVSERRLDEFVAEQVANLRAARLLDGAGKGDERAPDVAPAAPEVPPVSETPVDPLAAVRAASGRERTAALRELDDAQIGELMTQVALDREAPDRRAMMSALTRENERRAEAHMAAAEAKRAADRAAREAAANDPTERARALSERLAAMPDITPGGNKAPSYYAAGMQRARRSGAPQYAVVDNGRMRLVDREPTAAEAPEGFLRISPDGTAASRRPGGEYIDRTGPMVASARKGADRIEARRAAAANEPAARRVAAVGDADGTVGLADLSALLDAPDPGADHVDTSGLQEGTRAQAHAALDAIARVHRVEGMPRIQTITEEGEDSNAAFIHGFDRRGRAERVYRETGIDPTTATDDPIISMNPNGESGAFTFAHEYGHAVDKYALAAGAGNGEMGTYAVDPDAGDAMASMFADRIDTRERDAIREFKRAAGQSPTMLEGGNYRSATTAGYNGKGTFLDYRNGADEMWARAYSQFIAVRSEDPTLLGQLRTIQERERRPEVIPMQWPDEEFDREIAPAVEAVLRARGWMD